MKRAIIVHGWGGKPEHGWYLWLKRELEKKGFSVRVPQMPDTEKPKIKAWVNKLNKIVGRTDKIAILVGHSIGCQAILRYLEKLSDKPGIEKCIFIAPWMNLDKQTIEDEGSEVVELAKPWMETPINWKKVKSHCSSFICIFSDNDYYVPLSDSKLFKKNLNAKIVILKKKGHFVEYDGIKKLPEILQFIK